MNPESNHEEMEDVEGEEERKRLFAMRGMPSVDRNGSAKPLSKN